MVLSLLLSILELMALLKVRQRPISTYRPSQNRKKASWHPG